MTGNKEVKSNTKTPEEEQLGDAMDTNTEQKEVNEERPLLQYFEHQAQDEAVLDDVIARIKDITNRIDGTASSWKPVRGEKERWDKERGRQEEPEFAYLEHATDILKKDTGELSDAASMPSDKLNSIQKLVREIAYIIEAGLLDVAIQRSRYNQLVRDEEDREPSITFDLDRSYKIRSLNKNIDSKERELKILEKARFRWPGKKGRIEKELAGMQSSLNILLSQIKVEENRKERLEEVRRKIDSFEKGIYAEARQLYSLIKKIVDGWQEVSGAQLTTALTRIKEKIDALRQTGAVADEEGVILTRVLEFIAADEKHLQYDKNTLTKGETATRAANPNVPLPLDIGIQQWVKLRQENNIAEALTDIIYVAENKMRRRIMKMVLSPAYHRTYNRGKGMNLLAFPTEETLPYGMIGAFIETRDKSHPAPAVASLVQSLSENDTEALAHGSFPELAAMAAEIRNHPEEYNDMLVKNPHLAEFKNQFFNDPEIADAYMADVYPQLAAAASFRILEMPPVARGGKNVHCIINYHGELCISQERLNELRLLHKPGEPPPYKEICDVIKREYFRDWVARDEAGGFASVRPVVQRQWSLIEDSLKEKELLVPGSVTTKYLAQFGYPDRLLQEKHTRNPVHERIDKLMTTTADKLLRHGDAGHFSLGLDVLRTMDKMPSSETLLALAQTGSDDVFFSHVWPTIERLSGEEYRPMAEILITESNSSRVLKAIELAKKNKITLTDETLVWAASRARTRGHEAIVKDILLRQAPKEQAARVGTALLARDEAEDVCLAFELLTELGARLPASRLLALAQTALDATLRQKLYHDVLPTMAPDDLIPALPAIEAVSSKEEKNVLRANTILGLGKAAPIDEHSLDQMLQFGLPDMPGTARKEISRGMATELDSAAAANNDAGIRSRERITAVTRFLSEHPKLYCLAEYAMSAPRKTEGQIRFCFADMTVQYVREHQERMADIIRISDRVLGKDSDATDSTILIISKELKRLVMLPADKLELYCQLIGEVDASPSQELQRLKSQIIDLILDSPDPLTAYRKVEGVFVKNNLPIVGKVFKIFDVLYPREMLNNRISKASSPCLQQLGDRRRRAVIYKDLLRVHVESGNRSLRRYLQLLTDGQELFDKAALEQGIAGLTKDEAAKLHNVLSKIEQLYIDSQLGRMRGDLESDPAVANLAERYKNISRQLGVKEGQSITARLSEMFLQPIGFNSPFAAIDRMRLAKTAADKRARDSFTTAINGKLTLHVGDFLKGVGHEYLENILQNGSVAVEYLGASAGSDQTPFDTDVARVNAEDTLDKVVKGSMASSYGQILFALRDRGQFQHTEADKPAPYDNNRYEIFSAGGQEHYGIRTGFPSTEIDFMIAQPDLQRQPRELQKFFHSIAQNGYYIPVTDETGQIIFTPEMYAEYRRAFVGIDYYNGDKPEYLPTKPTDAHADKVEALRDQMRASAEVRDSLTANIMEVLKSVLQAHGVKLHAEHSDSILGAVIDNTGSTARGTNLPDNYDFDLAVRLDNKDFPKVAAIASDIIAALKPEKDESHPDSDGGYQVRAQGSMAFGPEPVDVDIAFVHKSDVKRYASHDAVQDKLASIEKNYGQEARELATANIILAKKILKEGGVYKKFGQNGLGGIGVENWILKHGGNLQAACDAFLHAANDNGTLVPFATFKEKYHIIDPGLNLKFKSYDNFIYNLSEESYRTMVNILDEYTKKAA